MENNGHDLGLVYMVTIKATGETLEFFDEDRLKSYMQEHDFVEDDYTIDGLGFMDAPFHPDDTLINRTNDNE